MSCLSQKKIFLVLWTTPTTRIRSDYKTRSLHSQNQSQMYSLQSPSLRSLQRITSSNNHTKTSFSKTSKSKQRYKSARRLHSRRLQTLRTRPLLHSHGESSRKRPLTSQRIVCRLCTTRMTTTLHFKTSKSTMIKTWLKNLVSRAKLPTCFPPQSDSQTDRQARL